MYAQANVTVYVTSNGKPVVGAVISSPSFGADFSGYNNATNSSGYSVGTYKAPPVPGTVTLSVNVTRSGFAQTTANVTLNVYNPLPPVVKPKPDPYAVLGPRVLSIPLFLLIPVVGASGVGYYMIARRGKKTSADGETDEELYL